MSFKIIGTGSALPERVVTNEDLSRFLDTSDEWITTRTGIGERRILTKESITDLAIGAAINALTNANLSASELDLIIFATMCGDYHIPSMACVLAGRLGVRCAAFDVNAACAGFIYALDIAAGYYARRKAGKVLIVCADSMSRHVDWTDRASCVLFGDGAAAVVLDEGYGLMSMRLSSDGAVDALNVPYVGGCSPFLEIKKEKPYLKLKGQDVYKYAVSVSVADLKDAIEQAGLNYGDISYFLLHQANIRIIDTVIERSKIEKERFLINVDRLGNTSAASIPILLDEANRQGLLKRGAYLALSAFGGGLTSGACVIKW